MNGSWSWSLLVLVAGCVTDAELQAALDRDRDGFLPIEAGGEDCDETRASVNPAAEEVCGDGIDNDCDGVPDDDGLGARVFFADVDGDGFGADGAETVSACVQPEGYAQFAGDCADDDPSRNPAADDQCDGEDDDCDGIVDDDALLILRFPDGDGDGFGVEDGGVYACEDLPGFVEESGDCDDADPTVSPVAEDACNGEDDNCNGIVDEDAVNLLRFRDADGDQFGTDADTVQACQEVMGYVLVAGDCDDADAATNPAALDTCDGVDRDCNGIPDDDAIEQTWYEDSDGDGFGDDGVAVGSCATIPGFSLNAGDCDDEDAGVSPAIVDVCDGVDTNCNGVVDDDAAFSIWFEDGDGDGSGDAAVQVEACAAPTGFVQVSGDCDDGDPGVRPGAVDLCDGLDQDCDGAVDEGASFSTFYEDADGDGLGAIGVPTSTCDGAPPGFVAQPGDCDDADAGVTIPIWYVDDDGDGFGTEVSTELACVQPAGFAAQRDDCDDSDPDANPGEVEVCNNFRDDDCSAVTDCRRTGTVLTSDADLSFVLPSGPFGFPVRAHAVPDLFGSDAGDWVSEIDSTWTLFEGPLPNFSLGFELPCDDAPEPLRDMTSDGREELGCVVGDSFFVFESGGLGNWTVEPGDGAPKAEGSVVLDGPFGPGLWLPVGSEVQFFPRAPVGQTTSDFTHSVSCSSEAQAAFMMEVDGQGEHLVALCASSEPGFYDAFFYEESGFSAGGPADAMFTLSGVRAGNTLPVSREAVLLQLDVQFPGGVPDVYAASFEPPLAVPLTATTVFDPPANAVPIGSPVGDLDADGVLEWMVLPSDLTVTPELRLIYAGDGEVDFSTAQLVLLAPFDGELTGVSGTVEDVDGDGFVDLAILEANTDTGETTMRVFYGSGQ